MENKRIKKPNKIKLLPDKSNPGAIIRWGYYLDNGVWITPWKHRKLWLKPRVRKGYIRLLFLKLMWGN